VLAVKKYYETVSSKHRISLRELIGIVVALMTVKNVLLASIATVLVMLVCDGVVILNHLWATHKHTGWKVISLLILLELQQYLKEIRNKGRPCWHQPPWFVASVLVICFRYPGMQTMTSHNNNLWVATGYHVLCWLAVFRFLYEMRLWFVDPLKQWGQWQDILDDCLRLLLLGVANVCYSLSRLLAPAEVAIVEEEPPWLHTYSDNSCVICHCTMERTHIVTTTCHHSFHFTCLCGWFRNLVGETRCPCCNATLTSCEGYDFR